MAEVYPALHMGKTVFIAKPGECLVITDRAMLSWDEAVELYEWLADRVRSHAARIPGVCGSGSGD